MTAAPTESTAIADLAGSGRLLMDVPLAPLTTYKFGGPARYFLEATGEDDLLALAGALRADAEGGVRHEVLVVGRGSNLVVADRGFDGVAIRLGRPFLDISIGEPIRAGGAAPLPVLARQSVSAGRGGLEFFVGIPGAVGGAVRMNAGCLGTETKDVLVRARVVDLETAAAGWRIPGELDLRYRHSNLTASDVVTAAEFAAVHQDPAEGTRRLREITQWRKETQPGGTLNAGSVFKNPPDDAAGRLIDEAGLKGLRIGGASVSERHANFFVAAPGTSAQDLYDLVAAVQARVAAAFGVRLEPEIRFAGDFSGGSS